MMINSISTKDWALKGSWLIDTSTLSIILLILACSKNLIVAEKPIKVTANNPSSIFFIFNP